MEPTKKIKSIVKEFVAIVKGDTAEANAQKFFRQADSALKTQISILTGTTISLEDAVEAAKENQKTAKVNGGLLILQGSENTYVSNLLKAKNKVTEAEETLKNHLEKLAFLESELKSLSVEVDA